MCNARAGCAKRMNPERPQIGKRESPAGSQPCRVGGKGGSQNGQRVRLPVAIIAHADLDKLTNLATSPLINVPLDMTKDDAIRRLRGQLDQIEKLKGTPRFSPDFKKWYRDTEIVIEHVFGQGTRHGKDFTSIHYNLGAFSSSTPDSAFTRAFVKGLDNAASILESFMREVEDYWESNVASPNPARPTALSNLSLLCSRFHLVAKQLRSRHDERDTLYVEDEYDVQDLFHGLLLVFFDDIRPEEWTPSYAGGSSRMDFLLKQDDAVVEIKKTRKGLAARQVCEELIIDIQRYQAHPSCKTLVCFVYDPEGRISNPSGIENDLSKDHEDLRVQVIIAPKGM